MIFAGSGVGSGVGVVLFSLSVFALSTLSLTVLSLTAALSLTALSSLTAAVGVTVGVAVTIGVAEGSSSEILVLSERLSCETDPEYAAAVLPLPVHALSSSIIISIMQLYLN